MGFIQDNDLVSNGCADPPLKPRSSCRAAAKCALSLHSPASTPPPNCRPRHAPRPPRPALLPPPDRATPLLRLHVRGACTSSVGGRTGMTRTTRLYLPGSWSQPPSRRDTEAITRHMPKCRRRSGGACEGMSATPRPDTASVKPASSSRAACNQALNRAQFADCRRGFAQVMHWGGGPCRGFATPDGFHRFSNRLSRIDRWILD